MGSYSGQQWESMVFSMGILNGGSKGILGDLMELMRFIDPLQKNCQMTNWKITRRFEKIDGKTHYFNGNLQELCHINNQLPEGIFRSSPMFDL